MGKVNKNFVSKSIMHHRPNTLESAGLWKVLGISAFFTPFSAQALFPKPEPGSVYLIYTTWKKRRSVVGKTLSNVYVEHYLLTASVV
jgi:hypothetical protein